MPLEPLTLLIREIPGWLAARGIVGPEGEPYSVTTIHGWIRAGKLPVSRLGRRRVAVAALEKLLAGEPLTAPASAVMTTRHRPRKQARGSWRDNPRLKRFADN